MSSPRGRTLAGLAVVVLVLVTFALALASLHSSDSAAGPRKPKSAADNVQAVAASSTTPSASIGDATGVADTGRTNAARPRRIAGRVVDSGHAGIADARCQLVGETDSGELPRTSSSKDGRFSFDVDANSNPLGLAVSKRGHRETRVEFAPGSDLSDVTVMLLAHEPLSGTILWPNGTPAVGARVAADDGERPLPRSAQARSDALGLFTIAELGDGPITLRAQAQRVQEHRGGPSSTDGIADASCLIGIVPPMEITRPFGELRLVLQSDLALRGRVVDERREPWTRFRIVAIADGERADSPSTLGKERERFHADDGTFELRGLYPGAWTVSAICGSVPSRAQRIVLGAGREPAGVELVCARGASLRGRVVDARGEGVEGARVFLFGRDLPPEKLRTARGNIVTSDAGGSFEFDHIMPSPLRVDLAAWLEGLHTSVVTLDLDPRSRRTDVELRMLPAGMLRLSVLDPRGDPAASARVFWWATDVTPSFEWPQRSERDVADAAEFGQFARAGRRTVRGPGASLLPLCTGRYCVRAIDNDWISATCVVVVNENAETTLQLSLEQGVEVLLSCPVANVDFDEVRWRVVDARGTPAGEVVDGRASRLHVSGGSSGAFSARKLGTRRLEVGPPLPGERTAPKRRRASIVLAPGLYRIEASARDGRRAERELTVTAQPDQRAIEVELQLH